MAKKSTEKPTLILNNDTVLVEIGKLDLSLQIRVGTNSDTVEEYAMSFSNGEIFPPVVIVRVTMEAATTLYLVDGFHRVAAQKKNGNTKNIRALIHDGAYTDAVWMAIGANRRNGLRLSADDKKKAIEAALSVFPDRSLRIIAEHVGCSKTYVEKTKSALSTSGQGIRENGGNGKKVVGKDGRLFNAQKPKKTIPLPADLQPIVPDRLNDTRPKKGGKYEVPPRFLVRYLDDNNDPISDPRKTNCEHPRHRYDPINPACEDCEILEMKPDEKYGEFGYCKRCSTWLPNYPFCPKGIERWEEKCKREGIDPTKKWPGTDPTGSPIREDGLSDHDREIIQRLHAVMMDWPDHLHYTYSLDTRTLTVTNSITRKKVVARPTEQKGTNDQ